VFKYECDITAFINALKEEVSRHKLPQEKVLQKHKKSSDSQLLEPKKSRERTYSDENQEKERSPSPIVSDSMHYFI
jgi:hypothetical protein